MSAADSAWAEAPRAPWPELDRRFQQGDRRGVPPFPLERIAAPWRPWIESHAKASTCLDDSARPAGFGVGGLRAALRDHGQAGDFSADPPGGVTGFWDSVEKPLCHRHPRRPRVAGTRWDSALDVTAPGELAR